MARYGRNYGRQDRTQRYDDRPGAFAGGRFGGGYYGAGESLGGGGYRTDYYTGRGGYTGGAYGGGRYGGSRRGVGSEMQFGRRGMYSAAYDRGYRGPGTDLGEDVRRGNVGPRLYSRSAEGPGSRGRYGAEYRGRRR